MNTLHKPSGVVVVTGMGAICNHGLESNAIFESIARGDSYIGPISPATHFDPYAYQQAADKVVAAVPHTNAQLAEMLEIAKPDRYDRHQLFALLAAREAMEQAGYYGRLERADDPASFAVVVATGDGGLASAQDAEAILARGAKLGPFANLKQLPNIFAGQLANTYNLRGASFVHCTACAASAHAIMQAADLIQLGRATRVLTGGAEAAITPFGICSFAGQRALGTDSRPYHKDRDGFVMGEGAGMLVLEDRDHALARGAPIFAILGGYGATSDGYNDGAALTDPEPDGGYRAALLALQMAGVDPNEVGYVNTHGTGTPKGDAAEIEGLRRWAGEHDVKISSTKSFTGHLLGAAGGLEAVLSVQMLTRGLVLPTRGLKPETVDPACGGVEHLFEVGHLESGVVLSNGFGFGGTNASLLLCDA